MAPIVSVLARAVRAAVTSRASSTSFAAVDVAGGGRRIAACIPRRALSGDASSNGLSDVRSGDSTADRRSYMSMHERHLLHFDQVYERMKKKTRFDVSEKEVESDEAIWDLYKRWCNHYKIVREHGEMKRRFNIFKQNACKVQRGDCMYGLHAFADDQIFLTDRNSFAAVDVAGGGRRIAACIPRRALSGDASSNGLSDVHSGDSTAGNTSRGFGDPPVSLHSRKSNELEKIDLHIDENVLDGEKSKSCLEFDEKVLESDEALWALYERWCKFYGIQRNYGEMTRRFKRFKHNVHFVHKTNISYLPYEAGLNQFADQEIEEVCGRRRL